MGQLVFQLSFRSMSQHSQQIFMIVGLEDCIFIYFGTYVEGTFPD